MTRRIGIALTTAAIAVTVALLIAWTLLEATDDRGAQTANVFAMYSSQPGGPGTFHAVGGGTS